MAVIDLNNDEEKEGASEGFCPCILALVFIPTFPTYCSNSLSLIDMAKSYWLWARNIYFLIAAIILLSATPIWAQSHNESPSNLARSKFQDPSRMSPITTGPTLGPSLLPSPQGVRLRPRDVTAISVDGYEYRGCVGDDGNKRVLGGPTVDIVSLEPTSCGNFYKNYNYAAELHHALPFQNGRRLRRLLRHEHTSTITVSNVVVLTATASLTTIVSSSSAPPNTQVPRPTSNSDVTLPKGAIIGIGAGSALGAVLICAAIYYFWFYRRRQRSHKVSNEAISSSGQWPPITERARPGGPDNETAMAKQHWAISEHSSRYLSEMGEINKQGFPVEAPGDYRQVHELAEGR
ncbi:hypothetical protein COCMIDRAFT_35020 [Bipolaris oryzae ATCC 44560]|uniref:Mid2 domain-containing protein n=1 Tax=Bipolaris oryzae ATCC 44560 TaxID=930090 RepID=W6ZCF5_COCMI|nr:uncharacterized protein COCMIDRAFT_35020 [Bipolaris oryzae ATCC 44560]EUC47493.1 hypothetical protein COCMIDRAFT_35020 [Bipolaris oryzae ATCC 44560]